MWSSGFRIIKILDYTALTLRLLLSATHWWDLIILLRVFSLSVRPGPTSSDFKPIYSQNTHEILVSSEINNKACFDWWICFKIYCEQYHKSAVLKRVKQGILISEIIYNRAPIPMYHLHCSNYRFDHLKVMCRKKHSLSCLQFEQRTPPPYIPHMSI